MLEKNDLLIQILGEWKEKPNATIVSVTLGELRSLLVHLNKISVDDLKQRDQEYSPNVQDLKEIGRGDLV